MYTFYVLKSKKDNKLYIGSTENFKRRFDEHCLGLVKSTRNRRPLEVVYKEEWQTKKEVTARERYFKSGGKAHGILRSLIGKEK